MSSNDEQSLGQLSHRMNNALAYVFTNLNILVEEIEGLGHIPVEHQRRLLRLADDATTGATRISDMIRELQAATYTSHDENAAIETTEDTWDASGDAARILVIDDEEAILTSLRLALRRYDVQAEADPRVALRRIESGARFDLVLCDLVMPGMSGKDVYLSLRDYREDMLPRVFFMTGGFFPSELRTFLGSIRNTVLHKPFDTKTLRWLVAQQLNRARPA